MSYILDALKKADAARAGTGAQAARLRAAPVEVGRRRWPWFVGGAAVVASAGALAFGLWAGRSAAPLPAPATVAQPATPASPAARPGPSARAEIPAPTTAPPSARAEPPAPTPAPPPARPAARTAREREAPRAVGTATPSPSAAPPAPAAPSVPPPPLPVPPPVPPAPATAPAAPPAPAAPSAVAAPSVPAPAGAAGMAAAPSAPASPARPASPAPAAAAEGAAGEDVLAKLKLTVHVYAESVADRMVFINGRKYVQGDRVEGNVLVEEITQDGAVLSYQGRRALVRP